MQFNIKSLKKRPITLLIAVIVVIGLFSLYSPAIKNAFKASQDNAVRAVQVYKLKSLDRQMKKNYFTLLSLFMSKTWEDKFAMYKNEEIAKHIEPDGLNAKLLANLKLLSQAQQIAKAHNIQVEAQFVLLPYLYKTDDKQGIMMGFIGLDCMGISIVNTAKKDM